MKERCVRTEEYLVSYEYVERLHARAIVIANRAEPHLKAVHTQYNLLNRDNKIIDAPTIDEKVAEYILRFFEAKGDTESFNIYEDELLRQMPIFQKKAKLDTVRHQMTGSEKSYTSTGNKLLYHWPIFEKYRDTGYQSVIRATMTLHQRCSSRCHYCSTIGRNRADSITIEEAKVFVGKLYYDQAEYNREYFSEYNKKYNDLRGSDIRLKGLILSGGGQPNLWPGFEEFVEYCRGLDIDLGLITNGFPPSVGGDIYSAFKWIRISITPEDASPHYIDGMFNKQYIPECILRSSDITTGLSYVYGPWTNDDILKRLNAFVDGNGFDYCRVLTDCNLTRNSQIIAHKNLSERLHLLGFIDDKGHPKGKIFHQLKYHGTRQEAETLWGEGVCYLQSYNVFWDTTDHEKMGFSYCYPCDSVTVLADENEHGVIPSERKFNSEKWGTVRNDEVEKLYREKGRSYFDPRERCTSCLFMRNNRAVKELIYKCKCDDVELTGNIQHINFP